MGDFIVQSGILTEYVGSGGNMIIPDGLISISDNAFSHCSGLTGVILLVLFLKKKLGKWMQVW